MNLRQTNSIILALLLWNPLLILMLSKNWVITLTVITLLIIVAYLISKSKSLRLKVWAFNLCALSSIALHSELLFREFYDKKNIHNLFNIGFIPNHILKKTIWENKLKNILAMKL